MNRQKSLLVIAAALPLLSNARVARADPIHDHCEIKTPWAFSFNQPVVTIDQHLAAGTFDIEFVSIVVPIAVPPSSKSNCKYESSDITKIDVTLAFVGAPLVAKNVKGSSPIDGGTDPVPSVAYTFNSGAAKSIVFLAHTLGDALHISFTPFQSSFTLELNDIPLVAGKPVVPTAILSLSGNHYFVAEPGTVGVVALGLLGLITHRRRELE